MLCNVMLTVEGGKDDGLGLLACTLKQQKSKRMIGSLSLEMSTGTSSCCLAKRVSAMTSSDLKQSFTDAVDCFLFRSNLYIRNE